MLSVCISFYIYGADYRSIITNLSLIIKILSLIIFMGFWVLGARLVTFMFLMFFVQLRIAIRTVLVGAGARGAVRVFRGTSGFRPLA
jgi:uncharacterized membrane protein